MENQISRRSFLRTATATVAAGTMSACTKTGAAEGELTLKQGAVLRKYPTTFVTTGRSMPVHESISFNYPDLASPCVAIKMDKPTPGGVGPESNIVAFSILCSHMGCPVLFDTTEKTFKCPCHYSIFDPEKGGQMVCGHATVNLPQIELCHDLKTDAVSAIGVSGLIYGRQSNIL